MAEWDIEEAMNRLFGGGERTPSNQGGWNIDEALERLFGGSAAPAEPVVTLPAEYGTVTYPAPAYDFWSVTHRNGGASLSDNPELAAVRRWSQATTDEPRVTLPTWYGGYPRSAYGGPESYVTPSNVVAPTDARAQALAWLWRSSPQSWQAQHAGLVTLPNEWGVSYPVVAPTALPTPTSTPMSPPNAQPPPTPPPTTPTAPPTSTSTPISSPMPTATATPAPTPPPTAKVVSTPTSAPYDYRIAENTPAETRQAKYDYYNPTGVVDFMHEKMITNASGMGTAMFKVLNSSPDTRNYPVSHGAFAYMNLPRNMFGGIGAGAWDYKPEIRELSPVRDWQQVDDSIYRFDVWTNIHFGYVGSAAGFSEEELLHGAGVAQAIARNSNPDRQPWNPKTWDDPFDQAAIRLGVKLWHDYGLKLQPADIVKAIRVTPGLARLPVTIW